MTITFPNDSSLWACAEAPWTDLISIFADLSSALGVFHSPVATFYLGKLVVDAASTVARSESNDRRAQSAKAELEVKHKTLQALLSEMESKSGALQESIGLATESGIETHRVFATVGRIMSTLNEMQCPTARDWASKECRHVD